MTALGAMRAIRARGLRVPEDVSVTGFDDLFFAAYLTPALTTVRQPMRRMGQWAMENLFKLMSGRGVGGAGESGGGIDRKRINGKSVEAGRAPCSTRRDTCLTPSRETERRPS